MHTDEAVHGIKFGKLLEEGIYRYDKFDYHGPTLNYFTFLPAMLRGQSTLVKLDEMTLRSTTAFFGLAVLLLLLLLKRILDWKELLWLTAFFAIAPMLVFYSRYYIQEVLFVCFNLAFIFSAINYLVTKKPGWTIAAGLSAGLMMATKETWIIFLGIQTAAFLLTLLKKLKFSAILKEIVSFIRSLHFFSFLLSLAVVYVVFYSSFFTWTEGIAESFRAFTGYFERAGTEEFHGQPWWYYLKALTKGTSAKMFLRADFWMLIGGIAGFVLVLKSGAKSKRDLFYLFWGYSTVLSGIVLSILSYKTPWNFLMVYAGLIFLSVYAVRYFFGRHNKFYFAGVLVIAVVHLGYQSWSDNFVHHANPKNTFVYSHPTEDVVEISQKVHEIYGTLPEDPSFFITVIYPGHDYWPLPWYFRDLPDIGWQSEVDFESPAAPLIISKFPNPELSEKLYDRPPPGQRLMYIPVFEENKELRPGAPVNVLLRKDYWDAANMRND